MEQIACLACRAVISATHGVCPTCGSDPRAAVAPAESIEEVVARLESVPVLEPLRYAVLGVAALSVALSFFATGWWFTLVTTVIAVIVGLQGYRRTPGRTDVTVGEDISFGEHHRPRPFRVYRYMRAGVMAAVPAFVGIALSGADGSVTTPGLAGGLLSLLALAIAFVRYLILARSRSGFASSGVPV